MKLVDPTAKNPTQYNRPAPRLTSLKRLRIGLLCNGKANARALLLKTATLFARRDGCEIENDMVFKANAGAPAEDGVIEALAHKSDFLLTASGD